MRLKDMFRGSGSFTVDDVVPVAAAGGGGHHPVVAPDGVSQAVDGFGR